MTYTDESPIPSVVWLQAAVIFLLGLWTCWPAFARLALSLDNQHYFFISERVASGIPPHVSQFDPKNALSLLMSGAAIYVGRGLGIDDVVSSRIVSVVVGVGSWSLVFLLVRHFAGSSAIGWIGAALMASLDRYLHMVAMGSRPKVFLVFFCVAAVLLVARNRPKSAGVAASAAFLCWQPALLMVALGALSLAASRRWRDALSFSVAAVALVLLYEGYFVWHGAFGEQIEQAYRFPSQFMSGIPQKWEPIFRRFTWIAAIKNEPSARSLLPLAFVATLIAGWFLVLVRPRRIVRFLREDPARLYCVLAAQATFAFTLTNYQGFPDRFFVEPFMAIVIALVTYPVFAWLPTAMKRPASVLVTVAAVVVILGFGGEARARYYAADALPRQRAMAAHVGEYLDRGLSVYCVGCTHLLAFNRVNNYTKYGFFFRGVPEYLASVAGTPNYIPLRNGALPDVILVSRPQYIRGRPWLGSEYERLRDAEFSRVGIEAYERKPDATRFTRKAGASAGVR